MRECAERTDFHERFVLRLQGGLEEAVANGEKEPE